MTKRPLPGRLKGLGYRNCVLRRGELRTLHRTHYRNIGLFWSGGRVGTGWIRKFHYTPLVLDLDTKESWECSRSVRESKKESSIVDNLEMGLDWQN